MMSKSSSWLRDRRLGSLETFRRGGEGGKISALNLNKTKQKKINESKMRNKLFGCVKIQDKQEEAGTQSLAEFL